MEFETFTIIIPSNTKFQTNIAFHRSRPCLWSIHHITSSIDWHFLALIPLACISRKFCMHKVIYNNESQLHVVRAKVFYITYNKFMILPMCICISKEILIKLLRLPINWRLLQCILVQKFCTQLQFPKERDPIYNMIMFFLLLQAVENIMINPHPGFWKFLYNCSRRTQHTLNRHVK